MRQRHLLLLGVVKSGSLARGLNRGRDWRAFQAQEGLNRIRGIEGAAFPDAQDPACLGFLMLRGKSGDDETVAMRCAPKEVSKESWQQGGSTQDELPSFGSARLKNIVEQVEEDKSAIWVDL